MYSISYSVSILVTRCAIIFSLEQLDRNNIFFTGLYPTSLSNWMKNKNENENILHFIINNRYIALSHYGMKSFCGRHSANIADELRLNAYHILTFRLFKFLLERYPRFVFNRHIILLERQVGE